MNRVDLDKMNEILKVEIKNLFDKYLKCETWINEDDNVVVSMNFLDTDEHSYSEEQMESYKDTIITYLNQSEFDESNFNIDYNLDGSLRLDYMA